MKKAGYLVAVFFLLITGVLSAQESLNFTKLSDMVLNRQGLSSVTDGKNIYAICGGTDSDMYLSGSIEKYDTAKDEWTILDEGLLKRRYCNAEFIPSQNKIYIFNGQFSRSLNSQVESEIFPDYSPTAEIQYTKCLEIIDLKENTIVSSNEIPFVFTNSGSAVWDNKIYVFGGYNPLGFSSMLYEFDPAIDTWYRLPDMPQAKQTCGKIVGGILYVFGGFNGENLKDIDAYNIEKSEWAHLGELPEGISANAAVVDGKNIWLVGDYNNQKFLAAFITETKTSKIFNSDLEPRRHAGAQVIKNKLYVFGGNQTSDLFTTLSNCQSTDISKYSKLKK